MLMDSSKVQTLVSRLNELTEQDNRESIEGKVRVVSIESGLIFPIPPETPEHNQLIIWRTAKGYTIMAGAMQHYTSEISFAPLGQWRIVDGHVSTKTNRIFKFTDDILKEFTGDYEVTIYD